MTDLQIERIMLFFILLLSATQVTVVSLGLMYIRTLNIRAENLRKDAEFAREKYIRLVDHIVNTFSPEK